MKARNYMKQWRPVLTMLCALAVTPAWAAESTTAVAEPPSAMNSVEFARVNSQLITAQDLEIAVNAAIRTRFYHGRPPQDKLASLQRDVGQELIDQALLLQEATRRDIQPDSQEVEKRLEQIDQRNQRFEKWREEREQHLPGVRQKLQEQSRVQRLEQSVRKVEAPDEAQIQAYYHQYPEKFTEPEQVRVSVILLKVDPSSPGSRWVETHGEARALTARLQDEPITFAQLAQQHSDHAESAADGGDMGYLHHGMLPEEAQKAIDQLQPGDISEPVRLLEGVAVFKLTERQEANLLPLEKVKARAAELWQQDQAEQRWQQLIAQLRDQAQIEVNEALYLPFPPAEGEVK